MARRILIIVGHPDPGATRFGRALAAAYADGAAAGGHVVRTLDVAKLEFPPLASKAEFDTGPVPPAIRTAQGDIEWAEHLVLVFPLWLGTLPALLKAFLEQVMRPGFAFDLGGGQAWHGRLAGRSARVVVTMGMPALVYRWWFGAHGLRALERSVLAFTGIGPIRRSLVGMVEGSPARRARWLEKLRALGRAGR